MPYTVVVILEAADGCKNQLKDALVEVIEPSRKEVTCLEYRLHQDHNNPNIFIFYENWVSQEAHQLQFNKPYIISLADKTKDLLAKPYQVHFAQEV